MRLVTKHAKSQPLAYTVDRLDDFVRWWDRELEDAISSRQPQEAVWRDNLRQYDGVPVRAVRNIPYENASNIEVTLGAIATDAVYAQAIDTIFTVSPIVTTRPISGDQFPERVQRAKALQDHIGWGVANEWGLRSAADESILDDVKLGTGVYYVPFVEDVRKTKSMTVKQRGPRILSVPIEDAFVPGGSYEDQQRTRWLALRFWYTSSELRDQARAGQWDISEAQAAGAVGWVRTRREMLGRSWTQNIYADLYEVFRLWAVYDIDGDGVDEDLLCVWDRTSRKLLHIAYNKYDNRPTEWMRYQIRGHLAYGLGVMDMIRPYQEECTSIHNFALDNALLANARFWKTRDASIGESMKIYPGAVKYMNDPEDVQPEQMADIYPSMGALQSFPIAMAERRVGINDLSTPRPSAVLGSRTPGITALSLLQQTNRRFTPAFDSIRLATAGAVKQCLYREQEQLLAGDKELEDHILSVHGAQAGADIIAALKDEKFDSGYAIELTASSATVNRDVERQNALLLVNILGQYYEKSLQLVALAANPQTPAPVRDVAQKIANAASEIIERTLRTFDQVRDPMAFLVDIDAELDQTKDLGVQGMTMLAQMMGSLVGGNGKQGELAGLPGAVEGGG
jgi:hypothetical protein